MRGVARFLRGAIASDEVGRVGRAVVGIEHVERRVARQRIRLVGHRGIEPRGEHVGPARMCAQHDERVGGDEVEHRIREVAPRCRPQVRLEGLRLVGGHERPATGVPEQHDVLDARLLAQPAHPDTDVDQRVLENEAGTVAREPGVPSEKAVSPFRRRLGQVVLAEVGVVVRRDQRRLRLEPREVLVDAAARSRAVGGARPVGGCFGHQDTRDLGRGRTVPMPVRRGRP